MANVPGAGAKLDPQAAIAKHSAITQSGSAGDQAIVTRIETAIQNSPMGWLQAQFGEVDSRANSEKSQVQGKVSEQKQLVASNQKDAPADAGAAPTLGPPTAASVAHPASAGQKGGAVTPKGAGGGAGAPKAQAGGKAPAKGGAPAHPATPGGLAASMGGAQNDAQLDGMLNAYQPKSPQPTEMIGRIKQMGGIAEGFRGQLDVYVAQGGAVESTIAGAANFLGVGKDASAVWATNPYRQMGGFLGGVMTGLSALKNVTGLVGSICGKLGMVLTVVGLLGMIFPPIGAAVSGIARILNVVGLICDAISFVLSAILTGLNGVVLAKQIAAGASAEEKAATADLMMSEANDAASGMINLAMMFGPKFMKGLTSGSRGVLNSLIRRFKAVVGRISLKLTGNIKNFANRIVRRLGFGGAKMSRVGGAWKDTGLIARTTEKITQSKIGKFTANAYNSAPKLIDKVQDSLMKKYGNSAWAKKLDRVGAWSGAAAKKFDIEEKVGSWGESAGKKLGGLGANTKFGKGMATAADTAERETREAAMKIAQRDAMHLEETRWKNHQKKNPADTELGSQTPQDKAADVGKQSQKDFNIAENGRKKAEKEALQEQARIDQQSEAYWKNDKKGKGGDRDEYMEKLHKSREKRWRLEKKDATREEERKALLEIEKRTPLQEKQLKKLNSQLTELDAARRTNIKRESDAATISGHKEHEVHNWHDLGTNVWDAASPMLEMVGLKEKSKAWEAAEKHNLAKTHKWNGGAAKGAAAGRGGHGTYEEIALENRRNQMADFAAFVALGRPTATVAQTVRGMLGSINRAPAQAPAQAPGPAPTATPGPAPTQAITPNTQAQVPAAPPTPTVVPSAPSPTGAGATPTPGGPVPVPYPNQAQAPQNPLPAPVPEPAADEGGGEPLPYWPSLLPEFDKAMGDFGFMRKVATEFKKAQIEGKQKAVDTLAVYGRYEEYAQKRQEQAKAHQTAAKGTQTNTQENMTSANAGTSAANKGEAKQGEAKGAANNRAAVDLPEPETRGFWGRILGAVKRWAKNKAAAIFGWIQEKVASVILKGLCGVSMGDLREYGGALRRQQASAHQVAGGAIATSGQAGQESVKLGASAVKEAQGAADAIGECDRNIVEADTFMGDVTSFEAQLTQEKAHAQAFLGQVHAAVHAEQARKKQEAEQQAAQEAAEQQRAQQQAAQEGNGSDQAAGEGASAILAPPTPGPDSPDADSDHDGVPDNAENEAAKAQITSAAGFVGDSAERMHVQVQGRAEDYKNQLALAMTNRTGDDAGGNDLQGPARRESKTILEEFKTFVDSTKRDMDSFRDVQIDPSSAGQIADTIIQTAEHLDENYDHSMQALDDLFERTYTGIRSGERDLKTKLIGHDGLLGGANEAAMHVNDQAYETAAPVLNQAADTVMAPIKQAPIAAPATNQASPMLPMIGPLPATTTAAPATGSVVTDDHQHDPPDAPDAPASP